MEPTRRTHPTSHGLGVAVILGRILAFLKARPGASLGEIAAEVGASPEAVRDMLATLQRKGLAHRWKATPGCGSACQQCAQGQIEVYCIGPAPVVDDDREGCGSNRNA